ncbi:hypothetical protein KBY58_08850 [Cyanobium sp. HWJ4-Hawea]|uniref:hypothetical protein n=1 Tax=unclassified Cyanobium TaxID=2627006 RepID=UPI0020CD578C|nr:MULTISPECIES: hypothetical protein [unclassified Cyanobium]MCP9774660.1 hypothetical protein [Cyanobium sp. WAJ14-Wanaka]MCP9809537.1 hypothetical protein [Cyanobium sp. HWJ4-Hawea]
MFALAAISTIAMGSPWWEDYGKSEIFLCPNQLSLVIERNDVQASVLSGRFRTTLFREQSDLPGLRFGDDQMRLILRGDVLTMEERNNRFDCMRSQEV